MTSSRTAGRAARRRTRLRKRATALSSITAVALAALLPAFAQAAPPQGWIEVDYRALVDRRQLSHSGESVGELLDELDGRPVPPPSERPEDRLSHSLLEPLVEPFGYVLSDALDAAAGVASPPLVEVAGLWHPGQRQPAWVELLRARRYVVESDGAGRLRICLPWVAAGDPPADSGQAARQAWQAALPVLRHVLVAERRRLIDSAGREPEDAALTVDVHAYVHHPARSSFRLGATGWRTTVADTAPTGTRPLLDLAAWRAFLDSGLRLEGARIDDDGSVRLLGSRVEREPTLLGRPLQLSDMAVAFRSIFHGGLAEPYMSLDRGYSPQIAIVNYGGRLRDTSLGMVSLLCDVRFKTFSLGLDIMEGRDLRADLRRRLPEFRSHTERFAAHPDSLTVTSQQTRLWFYPDRVDLTVSPDSDVLVLRRVRMSAASERVQGGGAAAARQEDPPWTRETVQAIDRDYDTLAEVFPELGDLDQVVRLLSLFTWLRQAEASGLRVPDLDVLLALDLPELTTPRTFPQLLAFNALPPPGTDSRADVFDRVPVAEGLERLNPSDGRPLPARRRLARALGQLDPNDPEATALRAEITRYDPARLSESDLDALAYRAERLHMHMTVISTLEDSQIERVQSRQNAGEQLRAFSVGIGGLDLGMGQVLARSESRSLSLTGAGAGPRPLRGSDTAATRDRGGSSETPREPRDAWRADPEGLPHTAMPDHGLGEAVEGGRMRRSFGDSWIETGTGAVFGAAGGEGERWIRVVTGADGPEARSRRLTLDAGRHPTLVERVEGARFWRYTLRRTSAGFAAELVTAAPPPAADEDTARTVTALPGGLASLRVSDPFDGATTRGETDALGLRLDATPDGTPRLLEADLPRAVLQRVAVGPAADRTPGRPLPALQPLPSALGAVETLMLLANEPQTTRPWDSGLAPVPGESNPLRLARSLTEWRVASPEGLVPVVVGTDAEQSPGRWAKAPRAPASALLLLPGRPTAGPAGRLLEHIREAWTGGPVAETLDGETDQTLVVLVTDAPAGVCAERLHDLARRREMQGKLLAGWCLAGPVRDDLPALWLAEGNVAGVGLAETTVVDLRSAADSMRALGAALASSAGTRRVELLAGPFLWFF